MLYKTLNYLNMLMASGCMDVVLVVVAVIVFVAFLVIAVGVVVVAFVAVVLLLVVLDNQFDRKNGTNICIWYILYIDFRNSY